MSSIYATCGAKAVECEKMNNDQIFVRSLYNIYVGGRLYLLDRFSAEDTKRALLYIKNQDHRYILKRNWRNKILNSHRSIILNEILTIVRCVDDAYDYIRFMIRNKDVK